MSDTLVKVLAGSVPVSAGLVAAAFLVPPDLPPLARQVILFAWGLGGIVVAERLFFHPGWTRVATSVGLVAPRSRAVVVALIVSLPMWLFLPLYGSIAGIPMVVAADWFFILLGVILVNGIAEEVIHRAFVFGHLRRQGSFAEASTISAAIFALLHVYLVLTIGTLPGFASVLLALFLAFPLAFIFERGGNSIGAPAVLHTSSNAPILLFVGPDAAGAVILPHMGVVLVSVYLTFVFSRWLHPPTVAGNR